jgi:flagellar hook-associated protein 2
VEGLSAPRAACSGATGSTWRLAASSGTATGAYAFNVTQLATKARRTGANDIGAALHTSSDVSGLTLANLRTAPAVTAGKFSINGAQVTVALTDSLQSVFTAISTATGGDVAASYNPATDKITLTSASNAEITLGAANDTSNILSALKLGNNGTHTVASSAKVGGVKTTAALASAGLASAVTAVDGGGNGSFSINGVSVSYNVNTDTLSSVISRINQAGAGVTAAYDAINDRVALENNSTGDIGIGVSEGAGGLLAALGLTTGATVARGDNAVFTVNGGSALTSLSNTLDETAHGIEGLGVTVDSETAETISVASDTGGMREKIDAFISAYNAVQVFIDEKTKVTSSKGKVTASVLTSNREVQDWARELRTLAFGSISGLTGTVQRLEHLGIDFDGTTGNLEVSDATKLADALRDAPADVEAFFQTSTTGFAAKFDDLLERLEDSTDGQQERINDTNSDLDRQIADMERRLEQQRELLTSSFVQMEQAQAQIQQQGQAITNAFFPPTSR